MGKSSIGDKLTVHYVGRLQETHAVFDSSRGEGREPFEFELGNAKYIKGWAKGLRGMCVGEIRKLIIPPEFGYGEQGISHDGKVIIPGGATLIFDIELLEIKVAPWSDYLYLIGGLIVLGLFGY